MHIQYGALKLKKGFLLRGGVIGHPLNPLSRGIPIVEIPSDTSVLPFPLINGSETDVEARLGFGFCHLAASIVSTYEYYRWTGGESQSISFIIYMLARIFNRFLGVLFQPFVYGLRPELQAHTPAADEGDLLLLHEPVYGTWADPQVGTEFLDRKKLL
jgi:hypothetical protein